MDEQKPFNWGLYEGLFKYFEKNSFRSLSGIASDLNVPVSALYEPLQRIEKEGLVEKRFHTPGSEAYFVKIEKNA